MKKILVLLFGILILVSCSSNEESNNLQIRISNVSEFDYENIIVSTSGNYVDYGNLSSNSNSEYKIFDLAYRYAFVELQVDEETYTFQPIDYVGETPLKKGFYSYEININSDSQFQELILALKVD